MAALAIVRSFAPDHMNYESLGNVVPHLHVHLVPRYRDDPRWGAPIWLAGLGDMQRRVLPDADYAARAELIRQNLGAGP
jgi:diadenosine tetraphosphate (Ap4A) HIT family hydrolase